MLGLTVNTDILLNASGNGSKSGDRQILRACVEVLEWIRNTDGAAIVLDRFIEREYGDKLGDGTFGEQFVREMASAIGKSERVVRYTSNRWRSLWVRIDKPHTADCHFIRAAMESRDKIIVAEEPHFLERRSLLWSVVSVAVHDSMGASEFLRTRST